MGKVIQFKRSKARSGAAFTMALIAIPLGAFSAIFFAPVAGDGIETQAAVPLARVIDREEAYFPLCSGPVRETCVVDGDTIWYRSEKIRLVGFDTPEISNPGCARERQLGEMAKLRLQGWLNEGAFSLEPNPEGRRKDRYGRSLLAISRSGENVAEVMLAEGLAERRGSSWNAWC